MNRLPALDILKIAAVQAGLNVVQLAGRDRTPRVNQTRQRAMLVLRTLRPDLSMPWLGRHVFAGRDHTTILHGARAARRRAEQDPREAACLGALFRACGHDRLLEVGQTADVLGALARLDASIDATETMLRDFRAQRERLLDRSGELFGPNVVAIRWAA